MVTMPYPEKSRKRAAARIRRKGSGTRFKRVAWRAAVVLLLMFLGGCATVTDHLLIEDTRRSYGPDTIISARTGLPIDYETLVGELGRADVIYIGETHTHPDHHGIQLRLIRSLFERYPDLSVGMEMFDRTYQPVLDRWSAGAIDTPAFLESVHWYANWKFDFRLYADILRFVQDNRIRLFGLNVPFHVPPKIAVGGLANLSQDDRKHLAAAIDTANKRHRDYVAAVFAHHKLPGRENFEYFYMAQCAWEDTMAESIARHLSPGKMVVLAGSGHLVQKFGIPDRAFARTHRPFKTVLPLPVGGSVRLDAADYLWVTDHHRRRMPLPAVRSGSHRPSR